MKNKTILITGGAGFIGGALAGSLIDNNKIIILDNLTRNTLPYRSFNQRKNISVITKDVRDKEVVFNTIEKEQPEIIIHCAAVVGVPDVCKHPIDAARVIIDGTKNILETVSFLKKYRSCRIEKIINFSTSEIYGIYANKNDESEVNLNINIGESRWIYLLSKLNMEFLGNMYYQEERIPFMSIRPYNIYGPCQQRGAVYHFVRWALKNEDIIVHGDGQQIRSWAYIDDMVSSINNALDIGGINGESFNIGNINGTISILDLAKKIIDISGSKSKIVFQDHEFPDVEHRVANTGKMINVLKHKPVVSLDDGLYKTIEWNKQNG